MNDLVEVKFENIDWHDSEIVNIMFDQTILNRIKILFDIVMKSHPSPNGNDVENFIHERQLILVTFFSVGLAKIDFQGQEGKSFAPRVAFIDFKESNNNPSRNDVRLFDYIIQMNDPEGYIEFKDIPKYTIDFIGESLSYEGENEYAIKRNSVIKDKHDLIWI